VKKPLSWLEEQERTLPWRWRLYGFLYGRWLAVTERYWWLRNRIAAKRKT